MQVPQGIQLISSYFPELSSEQLSALAELEPLYHEWNARVNVISRKDIGMLYERHVLHSLAIARFIQFVPGTRVLDIGTGGGFPGIPLAIMFPEVHFFLTDSIAKKIKVVEEVSRALGLQNVHPSRTRSEDFQEAVDFAVSRAVAPLAQLAGWCRALMLKNGINPVPNGLICLKGGNLEEELAAYHLKVKVVELQHWFGEAFFLEKKLVYLPL